MPIEISTSDRFDTVVITDAVEERIPPGIDGFANVFAEHTLAGLIVQQDESWLFDDMEELFSRLVPRNVTVQDFDVDSHADGHLRATLVGPDVTVPVRNGELLTNHWQSIILLEFDGPNDRRVHVTVSESAGSAEK